MQHKSFITNISFPKSLDEVLYFMDVRGKFDVQEVLQADCVEWTAPKDASIGEVAYFMHSKTSINTIRHLKRELAMVQKEISQDIAAVLHAALDEGELLYRKVGGSVFAYGVVCGEAVVDDVAVCDKLHWKSRHYAPIDSISLINPPIHISEFRDFITVSRTGAITKLNVDQETRLRALRDSLRRPL